MSNKKYIFFIDVDDTLIPIGKNEISKEIVSEIERLKKLGHIFVVSTGRALNATLDIKGIEVFKYISALMGSCIYQISNKQILSLSQNMPSEEIKKLIKILDEKRIEWSYKDEREEKSIFTESEFYNHKAKCKFVSINEFNNDLTNNKIMQFLYFAHIPEIERKGFSLFNFFEMQQGYTDVSLKCATKAKCIEFFKEKYPNMITVSIGDSSNDVPMFEATDISIVMGNSSQSIKEKTTYVTKDINDNGLIYAFRDILRI